MHRLHLSLLLVLSGGRLALMPGMSQARPNAITSAGVLLLNLLSCLRWLIRFELRLPPWINH